MGFDDMSALIDTTEMEKLHRLLTEAGIPHKMEPMWGGLQIRIYADEEMTNEIDDAICHGGSNGHQKGLLETYTLNGCNGWETAEQVFEGWLKMYQLTKGINTTEGSAILVDEEVEL